MAKIEQATQRNGNILEVQKLLNLESASNEKLRDRVSALEASMKESIAIISHQRVETQKTSSTMMVMSTK